MKRTILALLLTLPMFGQTIVGRFAPGEPYTEPERNAPAATSRMFVRTSDGQGVDLPATGDSGMIVVVNDPRHATASLVTPGGDASSTSVRRFAVDSTGDSVLHVDHAIAGRYHVNGVSEGATVIASEPESSLTLTTTAGPLSRTPGQPVTLSASLRDGDAAITGAHVIAHLVSPDGKSGDSITLDDRGDGRYEAKLPELPSDAVGFWSVRYDAEGATAHGVEFARTSSNQFRNERASARLGLVRARRDGDTLHVIANANIVEGGRYRLDVIVASRTDANGERRGIAWGESAETLAGGPTRLSIDIPDITTDDVFVDVRLLSLDTMGVAGRVAGAMIARE